MKVINARPAIPNRNWAATACDRGLRLCAISMLSTPRMTLKTAVGTRGNGPTPPVSVTDHDSLRIA